MPGQLDADINQQDHSGLGITRTTDDFYDRADGQYGVSIYMLEPVQPAGSQEDRLIPVILDQASLGRGDRGQEGDDDGRGDGTKSSVTREVVQCRR
jgi:hypothetical protein